MSGRLIAGVVAVVLLSLVVGAWLARKIATVDPDLISQCRKNPDSNCLADVAWSLARVEKREQLGALARSFAELKQWQRADELLGRISATGADRLSAQYVAGERLAVALSAGKVDALTSVQDPLVLQTAATRLLGWLPRAGQPGDGGGRKRLDEGLWLRTLKVERSVALALLDRWELVSHGKTSYLDIELAKQFLILKEDGRARSVAERIAPKATDVGRDVVELWLALGEPDRAFDATKTAKPRTRSLFRMLVAHSLRSSGSVERAGAVAVGAADDGFEAHDFYRVLAAVEFLVETGRPDLARPIALRAAGEADAPGAFLPFNLSAVGEMFGLIGEPGQCLEYQTRALRGQPKSGETGESGLVSGPITYGQGRFSLGPSLKQYVAVRRVLCGNHDAMKEIDNRDLARNYCDFYGRGLIKPEDLRQRPNKRQSDDAPLFFLHERAIECHFERREPAIATPLLQRRLEAAQATTDHAEARGAAELACVYGARPACRLALERAASLLVEDAAELRATASRVAEFAAVLQAR